MLGLKTSFGIFPIKTQAERVADAAIDLLSGIAGTVTFTRNTSAWDPITNSITAPGVKRIRAMSVGRYRRFNAALIEGSATNLLAAGSSEGQTGNSLGNMSWRTNATQYGPDPTMLMQLLLETSATGNHYLYQNITLASGTVASYQIVVKPVGGLQYLLIRENSQSGDAVCYDLVNGVVNSTNAASGTITALSGGMYLLTISLTANIVAGTLQFAVTTLTQATTSWTTASHAGNTSVGFYWTMQMAEASAFPTSYISNRNLLSTSGQMTNATNWAHGNATTTTTAVSGPFSDTMFKLVDNTTNGSHSTYNGPLSLSAAANRQLCSSFYVKAAEYTYVSVQVGDGAGYVRQPFNLTTGLAVGSLSVSGTATGGLAGIQNIGGGIYRVWASALLTGTYPSAQLLLYNGTADSFAGTGSSGVYVDAGQLEYGTSPTAYWGTDSAPGVRDADSLSVSLARLPGGGLSTTSGSILGLIVPYGWTGNTGASAYLLDDHTTTGVASVYCTAAGVATGSRKDSVAVQTSTGPAGTPSTGVLESIGFTYGSASCLTYRNGVAGTSQAATPPWVASTTVQIGASQAVTLPADAWVLPLYWNGRVLSSADFLSLVSAATT